ncbi:MAG: hypothetical protein WBC88_10435, partial [Candidatus Zixiibacteriota bacterium]
MKKKIICGLLCVVLLLIFTSLSYGGFDPRAFPMKEHPDQELLSPRHGDQSDVVLLLIVLNWNGGFLVIYTEHDYPQVGPCLATLS